MTEWEQLLGPCTNMPRIIPNDWFGLLRPAKQYCTGTLRQNTLTTRSSYILYRDGRKKRRRRIVDELTVMMIPPIVASQQPIIRMPQTITDAPLCIVNAISTVLPIAARVCVFGHNIPIYLCGVMYRHKKLTWVIQNMYNDTFYLSCHFLADLTHLCECLRNEMAFECLKKYNRQSFNAATRIYHTYEDFVGNQNSVMLTSLGRSILQFHPSKHDYNKILEFFDGRDNIHNLLKHARPCVHGVQILTHKYCYRGWKTFAPTINNSGHCAGGKRRKCPCASFIAKIKATPKWNIRTIIEHVPTTIEQVYHSRNPYALK